MISSLRTSLSLLAFLFVACGGGSDEPASPVSSTSNPPLASADVTLLFMGNSHTSVNDVPGMVAEMVRTGRPGRTVAAVTAPGSMFLEERVNDAQTMDLLRSRNWSFIVFQAQKYSASGQFTYSTAEAKELIRVARTVNAVPIMFPEWSRRGVDETARIFDLHVSIAQAEPACVAPIGQAWDLSLARYPSLTLHDNDGNHSAPAGAFLASLMLYTTITGLTPLNLPNLPQIAVDEITQTRLRGVASDTVQAISPRLWCPNEPFG